MKTKHNPIRSDKRVNLLDEVEGLIRAYVAIWGSPSQTDSYDTWFDRERPPEMDLDLLPIALRYEHGMDGEITYERIGEIFEIGFDDIGIYFKAHLDKSSPFFARVVDEIANGTNEGQLHTSSGSVSYLAEFHDDGAFRIWPVAEVSLTSMPAEHRIPEVELLRSERSQDEDEVSVEEPSRDDVPEKPNEQRLTENRQMDINEIIAGLPEGYTLDEMFAGLIAGGVPIEELQAALAAMTPPDEEEAEALSDEEAAERAMARFKEALQKAIDAKQSEQETEEARNVRSERDRLKNENALYRAQVAAPPRQPEPTGDMSGQITEMRDTRYDHMDAGEMAYGFMLLRSKGREVSEPYKRALHAKALERVAQGPASNRKSAQTAFRSIRSTVPTRADELMNTGNTGKGAEWIPEFWVNTLWEKARSQRIMGAVEAAGMWDIEIPMNGGSSGTVPLEGSDPVWHSASENQSIGTSGRAEPLVDPSEVGTGKVTVTPGKAMSRVLISTELLEDSIVPVLPQLMRQYEESFVDVLEYLFLNADTVTTASTNINLIDGTPASGTSAPVYLVTNGSLKYALVTGSDTSRDGGTLSSSDFLLTRKKMPNANRADPKKLLYISDTDTELKALELLDVKTQDVFSGATIENGVLTGIWGTPYLSSAQMALANSAGKISATAGNNTLGRILCVYPQYWAMVWKRKVQFKTEEDIEADVTKVVSSMRVAFQARGAGASTVSYNLTV
jgi:hypothetical protein